MRQKTDFECRPGVTVPGQGDLVAPSTATNLTETIFFTDSFSAVSVLSVNPQMQAIHSVTQEGIYFSLILCEEGRGYCWY